MITIKQTTDSRLAATFITMGNFMRDDETPVVVVTTNGKAQGTFFFDDGQDAPLTIDQVKAAWDDPQAFERFQEFVLSLVPEDQRGITSQLLHGAAVNAIRMAFENYRDPVMVLYHRSRTEGGLTAETRGGKTLAVGRKFSEAKIAELKQAGDF